MMASDVVFKVMATGQEFRTPEGVLDMLNWFYHGAFEARAETKNTLVGEGVAAIEGDFVGRHIGEFAGVPATGKDVNVPLTLWYALRDGHSIEGPIYCETGAFLAPGGALPADARVAALAPSDAQRADVGQPGQYRLSFVRRIQFKVSLGWAARLFGLPSAIWLS